MDGFSCTRRGVLEGALGLACLTCAEATHAETNEPQVSDSGSAMAQEWEVLEVADYPFSVRYRSGYLDDAEQVADWAKFGYSSVQSVYSHELSTSITFDIYPDDEWNQPHGTMTYNENALSAVMVTPSEYNGSYANTAMFYRHGITHEYVHAAQKDALSFHTHANWIMEGFAESVAVYHTDEEIYDSYIDHSRANETRRDIERGYGHLLGVNEYVYRGSMQLLDFMIQRYGGQAVGEIFEQDAKNILEAIDMRLDMTALDLEAAWLEYAQREIGGDYTDAIDRLGETISGFLSVSGIERVPDGLILVNTAVYQDADYVIVLRDRQGSDVGVSRTYSAGERVSDTTVSVDAALDTPAVLEATIHEASQDGYGDPVTIDGSQLTDVCFYSSDRSIIDFAESPAAGDESLTVDARLAEGYEGGDKVKINVFEDTSDSRRIDEAYSSQIEPGEELLDFEVDLDESTSAVPLSDSQTVVVALVDYSDGEPIVQATNTVSGASTVSPTIPGGDGPATSIDDDPLLEDVNGDGDANIFDALTYYNNRDDQAIRGNPGVFDFDGDGNSGTIFDALELYNNIS